MDQILCRDGRGALGRDHLERHVGAVSGHANRGDGGHIFRCGEDALDGHLRREHLCLVNRNGQRGGHEHRAVEAGAEVVGDGEVRLVLSRLLRLLRAVGEAEAHRQRWNRDHEQGENRAEACGDGREASHRRDGGLRLGCGDRGTSLATKHAGADEAEQGRGERDGARHGDSHTERGDSAHDAEEGHSRDVEGEQGDHDGRTRKHDRVSCSAVGKAHRFVEVHALTHLRAVAVENEEGVVNADGKAEHDAEHWGDRLHLDNTGKGEGGCDADPDTHDGRDERLHRRQRRAHHDREDKERDEHASDLADAEHARDVSGEFSREVRGDALNRHRGDRLDDGLLVLWCEGVRLLNEREGGECGGAVLRHGADLLGVAREFSAKRERLLLDGEFLLAGLEFCSPRVDRRLLLRELLSGSVVHARGLCLGDGGVELFLARGKLGLACSQLLLDGGDLLGCLCELESLFVALCLEGERVESAGHRLKLRCCGERCGHLLLLCIGERAAVVRAEDDASVATAQFGELEGEVLGHPLGFDARNGEGVGKGAANGQVRPSGGAQRNKPGGDHHERTARAAAPKAEK